MEKKTVLENLDLVLLAMDEIVDKGCVLSFLVVVTTSVQSKYSVL